MCKTRSDCSVFFSGVCRKREIEMVDNANVGAIGDEEDELDGVNVREQDRFLPIANISRIMKKALPGNAKIAKDAKETVQECVSEFISFITSEYVLAPRKWNENCPGPPSMRLCVCVFWCWRWLFGVLMQRKVVLLRPEGGGKELVP